MNNHNKHQSINTGTIQGYLLSNFNYPDDRADVQRYLSGLGLNKKEIKRLGGYWATARKAGK